MRPIPKLRTWWRSTQSVHVEAPTSVGVVIADIFSDGAIDLMLKQPSGEFIGAPETTVQSSEELAALMVGVGLANDEARQIAEKAWVAQRVDDLLASR